MNCYRGRAQKKSGIPDSVSIFFNSVWGQEIFAGFNFYFLSDTSGKFSFFFLEMTLAGNL